MRRLISSLLIFLLAFSSCALAEGKLSVTAKNLLEFDGDDAGYFFAKVENTGDSAIGAGNGKLVAFSENDDILISTEYVSSCPSYISLEPGESVYVREYIWEEALEKSNVVDYRFSFSPYEHPTKTAIFPCVADYELDNDYQNYAYVTFTNTTNEIKYDLFITVALWDTEGNLVFVNGESVSSTGVHPGSTVTCKIRIDSDCINHFNAHGIEVSSVDATVRYPVA